MPGIASHGVCTHRAVADCALALCTSVHSFSRGAHGTQCTPPPLGTEGIEESMPIQASKHLYERSCNAGPIAQARPCISSPSTPVAICAGRYDVVGDAAIVAMLVPCLLVTRSPCVGRLVGTASATVRKPLAGAPTAPVAAEIRQLILGEIGAKVRACGRRGVGEIRRRADTSSFLLTYEHRRT